MKDNPRNRHVGSSDYSERKIQPYDIWLEYNLNPWDADIVKRVLRTKKVNGESYETTRIEDYEKMIHICQHRIVQLTKEVGSKKVVAVDSSLFYDLEINGPTPMFKNYLAVECSVPFDRYFNRNLNPDLSCGGFLEQLSELLSIASERTLTVSLPTQSSKEITMFNVIKEYIESQ